MLIAKCLLLPTRRLSSSAPAAMAAAARPQCWNCQRPQRVCICECLPSEKILTETQVFVLQHPVEARRRKVIGTVPLLPLCLENVEVCVALFSIRGGVDKAIRQRLASVVQRPGTMLLYPGDGSLPIERAAHELPYPDDSRRRTLVVIDGTWQQTEAMMARHRILNRLPRFHLPFGASGEEVPGSLYGDLRQVARAQDRVPGHISTCEAVGHALEHLEPQPHVGAAANRALRTAMTRMVVLQKRTRDIEDARRAGRATASHGAARNEFMMMGRVDWQ